MSNISLVTAEQIRRHQTNKSPTKMAYKFSQSSRFPAPNPECPQAFYSYTSQLSHRRAFMPSQQKDNLNKDLVNSPPSTLYNVNNYYQFVKHRGLSFGEARQKCQNRSYLIPQIHKHPGVGQYDQDIAKRRNSSYSMRSRTIDANNKNLTFRQNPGPGAYDTLELMNKVGASKFKNSKLAVMHLTSPRFIPIKNCPGPSTYSQKDSLSPDARYLLSQHTGRGCRPIGHERRFIHNHWKPSKNPGPCEYQKGSQFGVYGDSKYYKSLRSDI